MPLTGLHLALLALVACKGGGEPGDPGDPGVDGGVMSASERLVRASMSLKGTRPSIADLDAVEANPEALEGLVDAYLESEEFGETVKDLHSELFLLRRDTFEMLPALGELQGYDLSDLYDAQVGEPLRLVEYIVENDRPYTEIVTADYTFANDVLAKMYGMPYDEAQGGWQMSWWTDDRPAAGLLSSAEMMRRWESNGSNFNRGRANMVAGRFLCSDFDSRDIQVDGGIDIADEFAVAHAVMVNEGCAACHSTLDPLAAYFWGYMRVVRRDAVRMAIDDGCQPFDYSEGKEVPFGDNHALENYCYPIQQYAPYAEDDWEFFGLRPPGYFGHEAAHLGEIGQKIADDPRFSSCMARNWFGYMAQVDPKEVPFEVAAELQSVLETSGFNAKALAKAVVLHETFGRFAPTGDESPEVVSVKVTRPEQYARLVEDLTGYRWWSLAENPGCESGNINGTQCWGNVDLSTSDLYGFRAMQGGVDSFVITQPMHTITPTKILAVGVIAQDAARFAVDHDLNGGQPARLLDQVSATTEDEDKIRAQLVSLHHRILGVRVPVDDPDIDLSWGLWSTARQSADAQTAWTLTIATLLQDPRVLFY